MDFRTGVIGNRQRLWPGARHIAGRHSRILATRESGDSRRACRRVVDGSGTSSPPSACPGRPGPERSAPPPQGARECRNSLNFVGHAEGIVDDQNSAGTPLHFEKSGQIGRRRHGPGQGKIRAATASVRAASRIHCSIRRRRRLAFRVSFRYFIGAHSTRMNRRRLSR